jgi:hypothetical protein
MKFPELVDLFLRNERELGWVAAFHHRLAFNLWRQFQLKELGRLGRPGPGGGRQLDQLEQPGHHGMPRHRDPESDLVIPDLGISGDLAAHDGPLDSGGN